MIQLTDAMIETQSFVLNCLRDYLVKEENLEELEIRYVSFSSRDCEVVSWVHHCRIISKMAAAISPDIRFLFSNWNKLSERCKLNRFSIMWMCVWYKSYVCTARIQNTSESGARSCEATKAVAKKAQIQKILRLQRDSNPWLPRSTNWAMKPCWEQVKSEFNLCPLCEESEIMYIWHRLW